MSLLGRLLKRETPAPSRAQTDINLDDIPGAWPDDSWVPDWTAVQTWLDQSKPAEEHKTAWRALTSSWLNNLADDLGAPYACYTTENFSILCPYDPKQARPHQEFLELTRKRLVELLHLQTLLKGAGPTVMLIFYDREEYLNYVSNFGEPIDRGDNLVGSFLAGGYNHIAMYNFQDRSHDNSRMETTMVKELARDLLARQALPLWLNEGLVRVASADLGGMFEQMKELRLAEEAIRECWKTNPLKEFWSGSAFTESGQRQRRAYQLSEVLTRALLLDPKAKTHFAAFVAAAHHKDAGEAAALEHLGASLGHWAGEFLGPGQWAPRLD